MLVRDHILSLLENGTIKSGERIPPARELALRLKLSLLKVQQGLDSLSRDGLLESEPRIGTYVQNSWNERILQENFVTFRTPEFLPWLDDFSKIFEEELPRLRISHGFKRGVFELRTTLDVQQHHDEYIDLRQILEETYPDYRDVFFTKPFESFWYDGRLPGIPFIFSPRVVFCNTEVFKKAGISLPRLGWTFEEFLDTISALKGIVPPERIINWLPQAHMWMNFVMRSGGCLIEKSEDGDICRIDSQETIRGIKAYAEIAERRGSREITQRKDFTRDFCSGNAAMFIGDRQILMDLQGFDDWIAVPLPVFKGGFDVSMQATDLICIRRECSSTQMARDFVKVMLSERVQDFIAGRKYGIPIRISSAHKSIDFEDSRDTLFLSEIPKMQGFYRLDSPELAEIIEGCIGNLLLSGSPVDPGLKELAMTVRIINKSLKIAV
ncbi:MAG: hypothetical protein A2X48_01995 [Lentisphaerae bacterium GWF2_49_21]|nr:MAG: hypothetical protein A2X48_01995 [Lentisphaerae bacterium GWF2_49_21]